MTGVFFKEEIVRRRSGEYCVTRSDRYGLKKPKCLRTLDTLTTFY